MKSISQPYETITRHGYRNQLWVEYPDEQETWTAELRTAVAGHLDFQNEASSAHKSLATRFQHNLRHSCGRARDKLDWNPEAHPAPNAACASGLFKDIFAIQNSCERTTLTLDDFTIQFLDKTQTLKMYSRA
jgi:hypothetical protein